MYFGPIIYFVIIDTILVVLGLYLRGKEIQRQREVSTMSSDDYVREKGDSLKGRKGSNGGESKHLQTIMSAFKKAFSGRGEINVDFLFENMGLTLPSGVSILNGVTGCIKSRSLTAIMGPSGGKLIELF